MIPNYKRPNIRDYIQDVVERPLTDEDLDMIVYVEKLEEEIESNVNFIDELQNDLFKLTMKNQKYKEVIDKAIEILKVI